MSTGDYKSPKPAQVWFLFRSRRICKRKYPKLQADHKWMANHVAADETC